jgi:hypothetical protein
MTKPVNKPVILDLLVYDTQAGHHWLSPEGRWPVRKWPKTADGDAAMDADSPRQLSFDFAPPVSMVERLRAHGFTLVEPGGTGFVIGTGAKPKRER